MERELAKAIAQLPPAKGELTRLAERYYRHEVPFGDPKAVTVWRWDGKNVVAGWPVRGPSPRPRPRSTGACALPARRSRSTPPTGPPRT